MFTVCNANKSKSWKLTWFFRQRQGKTLQCINVVVFCTKCIEFVVDRLNCVNAEIKLVFVVRFKLPNELFMHQNQIRQKPLIILNRAQETQRNCLVFVNRWAIFKCFSLLHFAWIWWNGAITVFEHPTNS